ncbi:MAG: GatB/YqeY domain-containing protein [Pseudomonadota bacterium]
MTTMLKNTLTDDMKTAMRAGDKSRLTVIRMALAAIKQREVDERIELDDAATLAVIEKMVKQRRESITQYEKGGRPELAAAEAAEIEVLQVYLPEPLDEAALAEIIDNAISDTGAESMRDMGKVMGKVKAAAAGRADMAQVSAIIKARLAG